MKQLMQVYLWMLLVTASGCTYTRVAEYDFDDPKALDSVSDEDRLQIVTTHGDSMNVFDPTVQGDSLLFNLAEIDGSGRRWRYPGAIALRDITSARVDEKKANYPGTIVVIALVYALIAAAAFGTSFN